MPPIIIEARLSLDPDVADMTMLAEIGVDRACSSVTNSFGSTSLTIASIATPMISAGDAQKQVRRQTVLDGGSGHVVTRLIRSF